MFPINFQGVTTVMAVLGLVTGIVGTFVIYFGFMPKKNEHRYTGWLGKLHDFLNFKIYIIEGLLKFCYVLTACLCTGIGAFMMLSIVELNRGLLLFVGGNLAARIGYEFVLLLILSCRSVSEMNGKAAVDEEAPMAKAQKKQEGFTISEAAVSLEVVPEHMFCPKCGAECSKIFSYCNLCGAKLK